MRLVTKRVLSIQPIHAMGMDLLRARDDLEVAVTDELRESALVRAVLGFDALIVRTAVIGLPIIEAADRLQILSRHGVGFDTVDLNALGARGIPVTITPGGNAVSVAEQTLFLMLALAKQGLRYDRAIREGDFYIRNTLSGVELDGKKLLLLGFGRTGSQVAPRAAAFGMQVYACDPYIDQSIIESAGCIPVADFRAVLPRMQVVSVHTPLNTETRGLLGRAELAKLPSSAFVINCARGGIVCEAALGEALEEGRVAGAGLDVFEGEPDPPGADHPLLRFDNVIVSPHCAGTTTESAARTSLMAAQNVIDFFDGRLRPEVVVNPEVLGETRRESLSV